MATQPLDVDNENPCPICQDTLHGSMPVGCTVPCGHLFHRHCFEQWQVHSSTGQAGAKRKCPSCNMRLKGFILKIHITLPSSSNSSLQGHSSSIDDELQQPYVSIQRRRALTLEKSKRSALMRHQERRRTEMRQRFQTASETTGYARFDSLESNQACYYDYEDEDKRESRTDDSVSTVHRSHRRQDQERGHYLQQVRNTQSHSISAMLQRQKGQEKLVDDGNARNVGYLKQPAKDPHTNPAKPYPPRALLKISSSPSEDDRRQEELIDALSLTKSSSSIRSVHWKDTTTNESYKAYQASLKRAGLQPIRQVPIHNGKPPSHEPSSKNDSGLAMTNLIDNDANASSNNDDYNTNFNAKVNQYDTFGYCPTDFVQREHIYQMHDLPELDFSQVDCLEDQIPNVAEKIMKNIQMSILRPSKYGPSPINQNPPKDPSVSSSDDTGLNSYPTTSPSASDAESSSSEAALAAYNEVSSLFMFSARDASQGKRTQRKKASSRKNL